VLSFSIALKGFQVIARWHSQTDQFSYGMQLQQLARATRSILLNLGTTWLRNKASVSAQKNEWTIK
jgi:hypothetical protein